jgi:hypothetical protein
LRQDNRTTEDYLDHRQDKDDLREPANDDAAKPLLGSLPLL